MENLLSPEEFAKQFPELLKKMEKEANDAEHGQGSAGWRLRRLGRITGSRAAAISVKEEKVSSSAKKAEVIDWINQQPTAGPVIAKAFGKYKIDKGKTAESLSDLTKPYLTEIITNLPGELALMSGAETLLSQLLTECLINKKQALDGGHPVTAEWLQDLSTAATRWGHRFEGEARYIFENKYKVKVEERTFIEWEESPMLVGISPDGIYKTASGEIRAIEIKCYLTLNKIGELWRVGGYDSTYKKQLLHTFLVTGAEQVDFIAYDPRLTPEKKLYVYSITRAEISEELSLYKRDLSFFLTQYKALLAEHNIAPPFQD